MASTTAYHGTASHFDTFMPCPAGIHAGTFDQAVQAATLKLARMNPEDFEAMTPGPTGWRGILLRVRLHMQRTKRQADARYPHAWAKEIRLARAEGYDSIVYENGYEGEGDSFVVFDPEQITIIGRE